jgi:hypothetical protein
LKQALMIREARTRDRMLAIFRRPHADGVWGNGLADLSLATLCYPAASWADVWDDEVVFLIPALASRGAIPGEPRPIALLRFALSAQAERAAGALVAAGVAANQAAALQAIDRAVASGIVRTADHREPAGSRSPDRGWEAYLPSLPPLMIFAVLKGMLWRLQDASEAVGRPLALADVLVGSVHARVNGAYAEPAFAFAHELLATGAWIGHVLGGRPALMPVAVAGCFLDVLTRDHSETASVERILLTHYAEAAGGLDHVLAVARRVIKGGRPLLMPGAAEPYDTSHHPVWDVALARDLLGGLHQDLQGGKPLDA